MKLEKQFKIVAYIISALILITGLLSVYFIMLPFFIGVAAPKLIMNILTVLNLLIPCFGITAMSVFIVLRRKQSEKNG